VYVNVNFNCFFKLIKVHFLVSELYINQNTRRNDKNNLYDLLFLQQSVYILKKLRATRRIMKF